VTAKEKPIVVVVSRRTRERINDYIKTRHAETDDDLISLSAAVRSLINTGLRVREAARAAKQ